MASLQHESVTESDSTMQIPNFDIDQYLNLDSTAGPSPSITPASSIKPFSVPSPTPIGTVGQVQQPPAQTFSGPSHQYEQYKQQTGLPVGALASTFALNEPTYNPLGSSYRFDSPANNYFGMNTVEPDLVDFNSIPEQTPSGDIDMDYGNLNMNSANYVDPSAVSGASNTSYAQTSLPGRVWPGMHQQAAMAKAQQQAQQQAATAAQRERSASVASRRASAVDERESEELVEESISRLLSRMRNSSVNPSIGDDGGAGSSGGFPYSSRSRKDEEDMDEDERLLASEEGKKLSSKERRQLRNKVSARAFRSRRKEYISQLEGELATKASEADEMKAKNQELMAENSRLTDLTQMLLSSPAFSEFLNDLSGTGVNATRLQDLTSSRTARTQVSQQQQRSSGAQKDANPAQYTASRNHGGQNITHIGMTMIPEEPVLESGVPNAPYNTTNDNGFGLYDAQVYALPSTTEPPSLDTPDFTVLNGKTSSNPSFSEGFGKMSPNFLSMPLDDAPFPSCPSQSPREHTEVDEEEEDGEDHSGIPALDESDPAYALYADNHCIAPAFSITSNEPADPIFGTIPLEKAIQRLDLVIIPEEVSYAASLGDEHVEPGAVSADALAKFEKLCCEIDAIASRVGRMIAHL